MENSQFSTYMGRQRTAPAGKRDRTGGETKAIMGVGQVLIEVGEVAEDTQAAILTLAEMQERRRLQENLLGESERAGEDVERVALSRAQENVAAAYQHWRGDDGTAD